MSAVFDVDGNPHNRLKEEIEGEFRWSEDDRFIEIRIYDPQFNTDCIYDDPETGMDIYLTIDPKVSVYKVDAGKLQTFLQPQ